MKSVKKVVVAIIICILFVSIINCNKVIASTPEAMLELVNKQATASADDGVTNSIKDISGSVITIVRLVCSAVAVAMLTILGIKYMSAAPSEKADIKKHAVVYIVGAVVMFACTGILGIIQNFAKTLNGEFKCINGGI